MYMLLCHIVIRLVALFLFLFSSLLLFHYTMNVSCLHKRTFFMVTVAFKTVTSMLSICKLAWISTVA